MSKLLPMLLVGEFLKVCFVGEYAGHLDEGMKNVMHHLTKERNCNTMYDILRELDVDNMSIALVSDRD